MNTIYTQIYTSPVGEMILGDCQGTLCLVDWLARRKRQTLDNRLRRYYQSDFSRQDSALLQEAKRQLDAYYCGKLTQFDLPFVLVGTDFQRQVWQALTPIAYATTIHYQALAAAIGHPQAVRAVANAVGANPLALLIPCHRVIGKNGTLTGFAGGVVAKQALLNLEQKFLGSDCLPVG